VFRGLHNEFRDLVTSLSTKSDPLPYSELHSHLSTHEFLHRSSLHPLPMAAPLLPTPVQSPSAFAAQHFFLVLMATVHLFNVAEVDAMGGGI
jgi:hypothetical protein